MALLPLVVVMPVNLTMSLLVLPRMDTGFLAEMQWGETSIASVGGVWSVIVALASAIVVLYAFNRNRLVSLRETVDAGLNASALPVISVASLVGFGAVVAALPAFEVVRDWVLGIEGGPLVGLALATNVLSALTGSASGGLTIALGALGDTYMQLAAQYGIAPALMHRVAVIGAGSLDSLPHNGAVVTLLAVCGATHKESYFDIVMVGIVSALLALVAVICWARPSVRSSGSDSSGNQAKSKESGRPGVLRGGDPMIANSGDEPCHDRPRRPEAAMGASAIISVHESARRAPAEPWG